MKKKKATKKTSARRFQSIPFDRDERLTLQEAASAALVEPSDRVSDMVDPGAVDPVPARHPLRGMTGGSLHSTPFARPPRRQTVAAARAEVVRASDALSGALQRGDSNAAMRAEDRQERALDALVDAAETKGRREERRTIVQEILAHCTGYGIRDTAHETTIRSVAEGIAKKEAP